MAVEAPNVVKLHVRVPAVATGSSNNIAAARVPFAGTVSGWSYIPDTVLTGVNTNTRALSLVNKGQAGAGTTVVGTQQFNSGTNAPAVTETALPLSVVAGATAVAAGDVLQFQSAAVLTGLADPGGLLVISVSRDDSL